MSALGPVKKHDTKMAAVKLVKKARLSSAALALGLISSESGCDPLQGGPLPNRKLHEIALQPKDAVF